MSHQPTIYLKRKRRSDEEDEKPVDQHKTMTTNATETESITYQTKLTDINDDCREKVFKYLSLDDLLNIAHTNTQLKSAADMVFVSKFGKKQFNLLISTTRRNEMLQTGGFKIEICDLKTILRLLRCYGHLIPDLIIGYNKLFRTLPVKVLRYINQYCSESLKTISFITFSNDMLETFLGKPLMNIEMVEFKRCALGNEISKFNTWFPVMRCLKLDDSRFMNPASIEKHFPQLEQLHLKSEFSYNSLTHESEIAVFRLNPQLRHLSLDKCNLSESLQNARQYLPKLEQLTINGRPEDFPNGDAIHFESVRKLKISVHKTWKLPQINLSFGRLEEVEMIYRRTNINVALKFFKRHQSITKLTLKRDERQRQMVEIIRVLPLLNDIDFSGYGYSVDEIIHFLTEFKLVNRFRLFTSKPDEFERLKTQLGNEWQATIDNRRVELKRRTRTKLSTTK